MMEMDGLDSAKWQKSKGRDINGILGKFNEEDDKIENSGHLPLQKGDKSAGTCGGDAETNFGRFLERESTSL